MYDFVVGSITHLHRHLQFAEHFNEGKGEDMISRSGGGKQNAKLDWEGVLCVLTVALLRRLGIETPDLLALVRWETGVIVAVAWHVFCGGS